MRSCFSFPLFKENIKRFWGISAIGFFMYFLSGPFGLIMQRGEWRLYVINACYAINNPGYLVMDMVLACIASVAVFAYLNKVNSAGVLHSMPFSRKSLFVTNYLSGLFIAIVPVVLNTLVVLAVRKTCYVDMYNNLLPGYAAGAIKIFTLGDVFYCLGISFLIILFSYSIAVLAGMVSGNSVIHTLTAPAFNVLAPAFYITLISYGNKYLYGFSMPGSAMAIAKMHPIFRSFGYVFGVTAAEERFFTPFWILLYITIAIVISGLAYFAYTKRKLEKAGDSYVFEFVKYIICFFFVFFMATILFWIFEGESQYIALFIGAVVGFLIGWMIVNKSVRIFNLRSLKVFVIYLAIIGLVILAFIADIFGYEKYIPSVNNIESCITNTSSYFAWGDIYDTKLSSEENLRNVTALHKEILDTRNSVIESPTLWVSIEYKLKNGKSVKREFNNVPRDILTSSPNTIAMYESDEYREKLNYVIDYDPESSGVEILFDWNYESSNNGKTYVYFPKGEDGGKKAALLNAIYEDKRNVSFEDMTADYATIFNVSVETNISSDRYSGYEHRSYAISRAYPRALRWLEENGYLEKLLPDASDGFMFISRGMIHDNSVISSIYDDNTHGGIQTPPQSAEGFVVVTDTALQKAIITASYDGRYGADNDGRLWCTYFGKEDMKYYVEMYSAAVNVDELPDELKADIAKYINK